MQALPTFIAHRGLAALRPENTLPAFQEALRRNVLVLETDVSVTADGGLVLMHDPTVDRTTDGTGLVRDLTLAETQKLNACARFTSAHDPCSVPTFDEFLSLAREQGALIFPEVKNYRAPGDAGLILEAVTNAGMLDRAVICSFRETDLTLLRRQNSEVNLCLYGLMGVSETTFGDMLSTARGLGRTALGLYWRDLVDHPERVQRAQAEGVPVMAWVVDSREARQATEAIGVRAIISNQDPSVLGLR